MRKFKFRAHIAGHGMTKPFRLKELMRGEVIYASDGIGILKPDDTMVKIMQFTGLTDKNGNEIYEGDILKYISLTGRTSVVTWDDMFDTHQIKYYMSGKDFEVIGNMYQNTELLEKTK